MELFIIRVKTGLLCPVSVKIDLLITCGGDANDTCLLQECLQFTEGQVLLGDYAAQKNFLPCFFQMPIFKNCCLFQTQTSLILISLVISVFSSSADFLVYKLVGSFFIRLFINSRYMMHVIILKTFPSEHVYFAFGLQQRS